MISSVTIVARARETTERIRTEGRKDRKGVGTDRRLKSDYEQTSCTPRDAPSYRNELPNEWKTGFSGSRLCDLRDLL
jgi:hypothetical protein